jgi:hypothetical protein
MKFANREVNGVIASKCLMAPDGAKLCQLLEAGKIL